jgi:carboxylesterase
MSRIIPTAEPFFFSGNQIACLLVHGFTGTPKEMRPLGEYLARQGYTVLGIRLAGHATHPQDMLRTRWVDWLTNVEDGYDLLKGQTVHIFLAGLSMGGSLALLFASRIPVRGVIAMSTPYALPKDPRLPFLEWLAFIKPQVPKGEPDWQNPQAALDHVSYPFYPTRSLAELRDLLAEMRAALPKVSAPTLLVHSRQDKGVSPQNAESIYARLGCSQKQILWLENSGHIVTREPEQSRLFQAIHQFIQSHTRNAL